MATTTPTSYLELSKTYQEQVLGLIEQSQKLAVESVSAWTKAVQPLAKNAPGRPGRRRPVAEGARRQPYGFATKLLEAQHEYFTAVFAAAAPVMPEGRLRPPSSERIARVPAGEGCRRRGSTRLTDSEPFDPWKTQVEAFGRYLKAQRSVSDLSLRELAR